MNSSRLVRGAKTRMIACICLITVLGAVVFVFHGTQSRLSDVQKRADDCNQQRESLTAQLQVIFEYKLRLEKSLKKEKEDHNLTKANFKAKEKEDKESRDKENLEAANKYEALVQQSKLEKNQLEDDKEALLKEMESLKESKKEVQTLLKSTKEELIKTTKENDNAKKELIRLGDENKKEDGDGKGEDAMRECKSELEKVKSTLSDCQKDKKEGLYERGRSGADEVPQIQDSLHQRPPSQQMNMKGSPSPSEPNSPQQQGPLISPLEPPKKVNTSTTPGINPDALYSPEPSADPRIDQLKLDNQVGQPQVVLPPKRSTQETLGGGRGINPPIGNLVGQIPGPPDNPPQPFNNMEQQGFEENNVILDSDNLRLKGEGIESAIDGGHIPLPPDNPGDRIQHQRLNKHADNLGPMNPMIEDKRVDAAVEEIEDVRPKDVPPRGGVGRVGGEDHYHGGDYDKEPPEEEEDEEGEQLDYVQANDQMRKEMHHNHGHGVMLNPK